MAREVLFDSRCYDLAEVFLSDEQDLNTDVHRRHLAGVIQEAIESEIQYMQSHMTTLKKEEQNENKED